MPWDGWADLRRKLESDNSLELAEVQTYPELRPVIDLLNGHELFTSKVDVFPVSRDEVDPEIGEAGLEQTSFGLGSYVDVLAREVELFSGFERFASLARLVAANLGKMEMPLLCLAEIVVRPARLFGVETFGWTLYAIGFGATEAEARAAWSAAAGVLASQMQSSAGTLSG